MNYENFLQQVRQLAQLTSTQDALSIIRSTLETLAERISPDESSQLARELPPEIGACLQPRAERAPEVFSLEVFFSRIARRENKEIKDIVRGVRAVTEMVTEAIDPKELDNLFSELPPDFQQLFDAGPRYVLGAEGVHTPP